MNKEFDVSLLDNLIEAAYDPSLPHYTAANRALIVLQKSPDLQTKADAILEFYRMCIHIFWVINFR